MSGRKTVRGTVLLTAANVTLMVTGYIIAVVLGRSLGPAVYGVYGIIFSLLQGVELISRFGVPQGLSKLIAEQPARSHRLEGTGITLTAIVYSIIFVVFWALSPALAAIFDVADGTRLFRIAAIDIPFFGLYFVMSGILGGRREFRAQAVGICVYGLTKAAGIVILLLVGLSVAGALVVNAIGSIVALGYVSYRVGRRSFVPTLRFQGTILRLAVLIGVFTVGAQGLLGVDLWSLGAVGTQVSADVKGIYVAARSVARLPNILAWAMMAVLVPSVARAAWMADPNAVRAHVEGSARFLTLTLLPACAVIAVNAGGLLGLIFSEPYREGAPLLGLLVFGHGLFYTVMLIGCSILIAAGHTAAAVRMMMLVLPGAVVLNLVLIRAAGATGAALAALIAAAVGAIATGVLVHQRVARALPVQTLGVTTLLSVFLAGLAAWLPFERIWLLAELGLLSLVYIGLLIGLRLVSAGDVEHLWPSRTEPAAGPTPTAEVGGDVRE